MLNNNDHPVAWALLICELDEAREHLEKLIDRMNDAGRINDADFAVNLGHICAHLNRAWHGRDDPALADWTQDQHEQSSTFPNDLRPVG